jgi:hypothetical protein
VTEIFDDIKGRNDSSATTEGRFSTRDTVIGMAMFPG